MAESTRPNDIDPPRDFFARLAERALGVVPLAQPVIAPIYAPDPGVSGAAGSVSLDWAGQSPIPADSPGLEWMGQPQASAESDRPYADLVPPAGVRSSRQEGVPEAPRPEQARQDNEPDTGVGDHAHSEQPAAIVQAPVARARPNDVTVQTDRTGSPPTLQPVSSETGTSPAIASPPEVTSAGRLTLNGKVIRVGEYPSHANTIGKDLMHIVGQPTTDQTHKPVRLLVPLARPSERDAAQAESAAAQVQQTSEDESRSDTVRPRPIPIPITPTNRLERRAPSSTPTPAWTEPEAELGRSVPTFTAAPQPPSTIRISIGRVEVRAVQAGKEPLSPPSASAQPASRPAPTLTLDEYLKQRNEARR